MTGTGRANNRDQMNISKQIEKWRIKRHNGVQDYHVQVDSDSDVEIDLI